MVVKITSKSKTVEHLLTYSIISTVVNTLLSLSLIKYTYDQFNELVLTRVIAVVNQYPIVSQYLSTIDALVNDKVLGLFDTLLALPVKYYNATVNFANSKVKAINGYYFNWLNFYLPKSAKISYPTNSNGLLESFDITNKFVVAVKTLLVTSSNELSNYLIKTYQQQYDTDKTTGYTKRAVVILNVAKAIANDVNNNYVSLLKVQTQDYVNDFTTQTKTKADTFISDAKQGIPSFIKSAKAEASSTPLAEAPKLVVPPVSASA